jgi:transcriptional regulator CtsR
MSLKLNFSPLGIKNHTQLISNMMRQIQEEVAGDVFNILIEQLRDQAIIINTDQPEILGESSLKNYDIIGKDFNMDFLISTPKNLIEDAKQKIQRLINKAKRREKKAKILKKKIVQKGKSLNSLFEYPFTLIHLLTLIVHNL